MPLWYETDRVIPVAIFAVVGLVLVTLIVAHFWAKVRRTEVEATLKRDMIGRGMSADEIRKVLEATSDADVFARSFSQQRYQCEQELVEKMIEQGMSADEIRKVLEATSKLPAATRGDARPGEPTRVPESVRDMS